MVCLVGVGCSEHTESPAAAREATTRALAEAGGTGEPALVLVFHTANHDPVRFHAAVRAVVGPRALLVGGYAGGVITRDHLGHDGWQSAVAVIFSTTIKFEAFLERGLRERGEHAVGEALGAQVRAAIEAIGPGASTGLLYMYDSIKSHAPTGFDLNIGTHLIAGMQRALGAWPLAAGMGMIGDIQFRPTRQYFGDQVVDQSAIAVLAHGGGVRLDVEVLHGTKPASDYHTVTRAEGNVVLELDGAPALDVIDALIGGERRWEEYPMLLTLGVNKGDKYADYDEEAYASRLCLAIDRERKALVMFEPDLTAGTEVQLMRRDVDNFDYIHARAARLGARLAGRRPVFALYIDCLGRASAYCGSEREEAAVIQDVLGAHMPLLGLYTGVEIAPVGATPQQALDWTGVLWVLSEPAA